MNAKERIGVDGPVVRRADGAPLLTIPAGWDGPLVQRFAIPRDAQSGPMCTGVPVVFVSTRGAGRRWYRSGLYRQEMAIGPFIDLLASSYERDFARWESSGGESIAIRMCASFVDACSDDRGSRFDIPTRFNLVDARLTNLATCLAAELETGMPNGRMYAEGIALALFGWLAHHYAVTPARETRMRRLDRGFGRRVDDFIDAHIGDNIGIVQLAALAHLSPDHFGRVFKATFGLPPYQYVLRRRIQLAARELRRTPGRPIVDIAIAHGFVSQAHFTGMFHRAYGMTPATWRIAGSDRVPR